MDINANMHQHTAERQLHIVAAPVGLPIGEHGRVARERGLLGQALVQGDLDGVERHGDLDLVPPLVRHVEAEGDVGVAEVDEQARVHDLHGDEVGRVAVDGAVEEEQALGAVGGELELDADGVAEDEAGAELNE